MTAKEAEERVDAELAKKLQMQLQKKREAAGSPSSR